MSRIGRSSSGGSVNINDSNGNPLDSTSGALNVVVAPGGTVVSSYNEVTSVGTNIHAIIQTYTATTKTFLQRIAASSDNNAEITVLLNGDVIDKKRTWYTNFNVTFEFDNLPLSIGDIIQVQGVHSRPFLGEYNARIQVLEE